MDRFSEMQVFVAVAELESFAAGARRLNLSAPAVTRSIAQLEARLGVKLLQRTTRFVRPTEAGARYLEDARRVIAAADEADEAAIGINTAPRGHLTITAPVLFGRLYVMPCVVNYLQQHPQTQITALLVDRVVNMLEEGVEVAVRIGPLADSSYKALQVGSVRKLLCAAPNYLAQHGVPSQPQELAARDIIVASNLGPKVEWRFGRGSDLCCVRIKPRLTVSSNDAAIAAAVAGLGIARLMSYQIADEVAAGRLQIILADYEPPALPIHIVHREGRAASAKIRSFIDLLAAQLRAHQWLN